MPDIIHVDMDCFFAAVEVKDNPDLAGKPVIVGALPGGRGVVSAASYEARTFGIHSAMPISQAYKRCPHGVFLSPNGKRYVEESDRIMAVFRRFTPLVEPLSLDEAFLDVAGSHRLWGTSEDIARALKKTIRGETGLRASVGVAPTKFVAKIASDLKKPDGFVVVYEDEVGDFLRPLDVRRIWGVGAKTAKTLERRGLKTIGDIAGYPVEELERLFGKHGRHLHNLACGIDNREVIPSSDRKQVSNEYTFPEDTGDRTEVERVLLALADKVAGRLLAKDIRGRTVTLKVRDESFRTRSRARSLEHPVRTAQEIYRVARDLLRAEDLGGLKIRLIGVGVTALEGGDQLELFGDRDESTHRMDEVVADIRRRFGKTAITRASLVDRPEKDTHRSPEKDDA